MGILMFNDRSHTLQAPTHIRGTHINCFYNGTFVCITWNGGTQSTVKAPPILHKSTDGCSTVGNLYFYLRSN